MIREMEEMYRNFGISENVYKYCMEVEQSLRERFAQMDEVAEYNQMKVIAAMQKHHVNAECFNATTRCV